MKKTRKITGMFLCAFLFIWHLMFPVLLTHGLTLLTDGLYQLTRVCSYKMARNCWREMAWPGAKVVVE